MKAGLVLFENPSCKLRNFENYEFCFNKINSKFSMGTEYDWTEVFSYNFQHMIKNLSEIQIQFFILPTYHDSSKSSALGSQVANVPRALRTLVPHVPRVLRASVYHVPRTLRVSLSHMPLAFCALMPHVHRVLRALLAHVQRALPALVPHVLLCPTCFSYLVPCMLHVPISTLDSNLKGST